MVASDRENRLAKAGKKSGGFTMPPAPIPDRQLARDNGEQQFTAKQHLTVEREVTGIVYDKTLKLFVNRTRTITVAVDHLFDPTRGRLVLSPIFREKKEKAK